MAAKTQQHYYTPAKDRQEIDFALECVRRVRASGQHKKLEPVSQSLADTLHDVQCIKIRTGTFQRPTRKQLEETSKKLKRSSHGLERARHRSSGNHRPVRRNLYNFASKLGLVSLKE